jgi:ribokinase
VGYNIAKAPTTLGDSVRFVSMIGGDALGQMAKATIRADGLPADLVLETLRETPQSVILFDHEGRRQINVDLKDIQELIYPEDRFIQALDECDLAVLSNINFSRPMLRIARDCGIPIATDVHAISDLEDEYNQDFMAAATILFTSHEHLPCAPEEWVRRVQGRYGTEIVVVGLGTEGALLAVKDENVLGTQKLKIIPAGDWVQYRQTTCPVQGRASAASRPPSSPPWSTSRRSDTVS